MTQHRGRTARRVIAVAVVTTSLLAACGGDDGASENASDQPTTTSTTDTSEVPTTASTIASTESTDTTSAVGPATTQAPIRTTSTTTATTIARGTTATTRPRATTTSTTARPAGTSSANKGTIKIGVLGTEVNARGQLVTPETKQMTQAWTETMNSAGGVNGYKIQVIYKRVDADSARTLAAVKDLDNQGVVAITSGDASVMPTVSDYLNKASLPVVGGQPYTTEFDYQPMYFPVQAGQSAGNYGQVAAARDVGAKHFRNLFCSDVAACAASVPLTRYAAGREGLRFSSESASAAATDYTATCLSAKNAGVDFAQSNGLSFANLIRDCARQNFHPTYAQGGSANQAVIDAAKGESVAGNLTEWGVFYNGPEVQRFRATLAKTDFKVDEGTATQTSVHMWLAMEMIGAVAKRMNDSTPTRADFVSALYTVNGETLDGQIAPQNYTVQTPGTGQHAASDCWTEYIVKDGKLYLMNKSGQIATRMTFICGTGFKYTTSAPPVV